MNELLIATKPQWQIRVNSCSLQVARHLCSRRQPNRHSISQLLSIAHPNSDVQLSYSRSRVLLCLHFLPVRVPAPGHRRRLSSSSSTRLVTRLLQFVFFQVCFTRKPCRVACLSHTRELPKQRTHYIAQQPLARGRAHSCFSIACAVCLYRPFPHTAASCLSKQTLKQSYLTTPMLLIHTASIA